MGKANPAPPIGPALGQAGINIGDFVNKFNTATKAQIGDVLPVVITLSFGGIFLIIPSFGITISAFFDDEIPNSAAILFFKRSLLSFFSSSVFFSVGFNGTNISSSSFSSDGSFRWF